MKKYRESPEVVNLILAHHGDEEPRTVQAVLVAAADAIFGSSPRRSQRKFGELIEASESVGRNR